MLVITLIVWAAILTATAWIAFHSGTLTPIGTAGPP
jgi:hypothetical protein